MDRSRFEDGAFEVVGPAGCEEVGGAGTGDADEHPAQPRRAFEPLSLFHVRPVRSDS